MVENYLRQSALAHLGLEALKRREAATGAVRLHEKPLPAAVNLRGDPNNQAFLASIVEATGIDLPLQANSVSTGRDLAILWLGPNEWLLVGHDTEPDAAPQFADKLRRALAYIHAAVTEVGESLVCIHVAGPRAADVIAKGCPLDLHASAFGGAGHCAQSHLSKTAITLHQVSNEESGGPAFDLYTRRSFADYLWHWLSDAAREYGGASAGS